MKILLNSSDVVYNPDKFSIINFVYYVPVWSLCENNITLEFGIILILSAYKGLAIGHC